MHPLKNYLKYLLYTLRDWRLPKNNPTVKDKTLCIIKMDAIGDYILFRNCIEVLAKSTLYKDYEITLVGNILWKELAEKLDQKWITHFIWIDPKRFQKNFTYRKKCFHELQQIEYSVLIHPTVSRDFYVAETISTAVFAKQKIAAESNLINTSRWQKRMADRHYTHFISIPNELQFEFEKNQFFINSLLEHNYNIDLYINNIKAYSTSIISDPYCILFIGGSAEFRKWSLSNWKKMIAHILSTYTEDIVIAGGPNDEDLANDLIDAFKGNKRIKSLVGKTSLVELLQLISGAQWMISNETSAPHIAVALNTPVLVISNANHYGRFTPYPAPMNKKYQAIFPPIVMKLKDEDKRAKAYSAGSKLDINSIDVSAAKTALLRLLS